MEICLVLWHFSFVANNDQESHTKLLVEIRAHSSTEGKDLQKGSNQIKRPIIIIISLVFIHIYGPG